MLVLLQAFSSGRVGADRRRGDRERRQRLPAAPVGERRAHAARARHDRDQALPRRLVARRAHARPSERRPIPCSRRSRARRFPAGGATSFIYWVVQIFTFAILVLAANTSYQGFPRLAALLARDRFFARQFTNLGDRLVFSNGVVVLTGARDGADRHLPRERQLADPPLRGRRLHGVHALAGGHGALLAAHAGPGLAVSRRGQHASAP